MKQIRKNYFIDEIGNVYSNLLRGSKIGTLGPLRIIKPRYTNKGHAYVDFGRTGGRYYVHHLVLEMFVCPRPKGMLALHKDDNKLNNSVDNLYWGTYKQNSSDAKRNGTFKTHFYKGMVPLNSTPVRTVKEILELRKTGMFLKDIAENLNLSYPTVQKYVAKGVE